MSAVLMLALIVAAAQQTVADAVMDGDAAAVERAKADVTAANADGATALTAAAFGGYDDVVQLLIAGHADAKQKDKQGRTPLMAASVNGHPSVVRTLLASGADPQAADAAGGTAVTYAAGGGHADILETLLKAGGRWRDADLVLAAEGCHASVVETMLKLGAPANAASNGHPALFMATWGH